MRLRFLFLLVLLLALASVPAAADTVQYGDTVYVFPAEESEPSMAFVSVRGLAYDEDTFQTRYVQGLPGAAFGIYAKNAQGAYVPFPDPQNPLIPYIVISTGEPMEIALPGRADLYIKQEAAPQGYLIDTDTPEYTLLAPGGSVEYTNPQAGGQGLLLTLAGDDGAPLEGIAFELEGMGRTYPLLTDEQGSARVTDMEPGPYVLRQTARPEGYHIDAPEIELEIESNVPVRLSLQNSRDGMLMLRARGLAIDAGGDARLLPIDREYEVLDAQGISMGTVASGGSLALPASGEGIRYSARAVGQAADGFLADAQVYVLTVYPGKTTMLQPILKSHMGFFSFMHIAEEGAPVAGGVFVIEDESGKTVLTFEADEQGRYAPLSPLVAGTYILRMEHAAPDHIYSGDSLSFEIIPPFEAQEALTAVTFVSEPVPEALAQAEVAVNTVTLPSLFDADASVDFTLSLDAEGLPLQALTYEFTLPDYEGLTVSERRADGARVKLARRLELEGVGEIKSLVIEGEVSYAFEYPVDAQGGMRQLEVTAPFSVEAAIFEPTARATPFVVSGHVYDEENLPVPGIRVTWGDLQTVTDPFGAYAFGATREEEITFHTQPGYGARMQGDDATILPLRTITGQAFVHGDIDGYPVMLYLGGEGPVEPGPNGRFSVTGPISFEDTWQAQTPEGILAQVDNSGVIPVVNLYPAASIEGRAEDPEGAPVADVQVLLEGREVSVQTQTDGQGVYRFDDLLPGEYVLTFNAPVGYVLNEAATRTVALEAGDAHDEGIVDVMRTATIDGRLLEGDTPCAGVIVALLPTPSEAVTDAQGYFAFEGLPTGVYSLRFDMPESMLVTEGLEDIVLTRAGEHLTYTVHAMRPAGLSGRIWYDANDDGLASTDEAGQAGAVLTLLDGDAAQAGGITTDGSGQFSFEGLLPGTYRLVVTLPEGMIFSREAPGTERLVVGVDSRVGESAWYTLGSGDTLDNLMAGAIDAGQISGTVWEDTDGDGMLDEDEPLLAGISVELIDKSGAARATQTDMLGDYRFDNLRPGDYTVRMTLPEGGMFTRKGSGSGIVSTVAASDASTIEHKVSLRRWRMESEVNAGMQRAASISAHIWEDAVAGGVNPGGAGLEGVGVSLYRVQGSGETLEARAATDAKGNVAFSGLRPGDFRLRYEMPDGAVWGFTAGVSQEQGGAGFGQGIALQSGAAYKAPDVGITRLGSIGGIAFVDADYNGLRDNGETGLAAAIALMDGEGKVLRQAQAGRDGAYAFEGVPAGMYAVRFTLPSGYAFTRYRTDAPSYNSDVPEGPEPQAQTDAIYLPMGENLLIDAGAYRKASLAGLVWEDVGNRGYYEYDNPPLAGIPVRLLRDGEIQADTQTDAEGAFRFADIPPGGYVLEVALPEDMRFSEPGGRTRRSIMPPAGEATARTETLTVKNGENIAELDIGAVRLGEVSGQVLDKKSGAGLPGVAVALVRGSGAAMEAVTDAQGLYRFEKLRPGQANVSFAAPEGYALDADTSKAHEIRIPQGEAVRVDASCIPEAVVSGRLWLDPHAGAGDTEGRPMRDVAVSLYQQEAGKEPLPYKTVHTDANGQFRFAKLLPGAYDIALELPEGILCYEGNGPWALALDMGETAELDIPAFEAARMEGLVWEDLNSDSLWTEEEPVLADIRVTLLTADGMPMKETATDTAGIYVFEALPPGEYALRITLPDGYMFTAPTPGGSILPRSDSGTAQTEVITVEMGAGLTGLSAGALRHTRIGDLVWLDENGNGLQDTGEAGLEGIAVRLWQEREGERVLVAETVTDGNGWYRFDTLRPGEYAVSFDLGEAYWPTRPVEGLGQINSKLPWQRGDTLGFGPFTARSGRYALNIDAGLVTPGMAQAFGWQADETGAISAP